MSIPKRIGLCASSLVLVVVLLLASGCGGARGASGSGLLVYSTFWGLNSPADSSQFVRVINPSGEVVQTFSLNRSGATQSEHVVSGLLAGEYIVKAEFFTEPNTPVGALTGVTQRWVRVGGAHGTTRVRTSAGQTPIRMVVEPNPAALQVRRTHMFVATVYDSSDRSVFLPEDAFTWSVVGEIGTIAPNGVFTATQEGTGRVQASAVMGTLSAWADVTVDPFVVRRTQWTVLVFLNAANDLAPFSVPNVNQMETVANNPEVRFVVQWKLSRDLPYGALFDGVRRYVVRPDNTPSIASELVQSDLVDSQGRALDMGSYQTLRDFIQWGKTYYPADRTVLIVWNHGNGWRRGVVDDMPTRAFSYDDEFGTSIKTWEIDEALGGHHFDILAWDASLMQMLEVAYEARANADYVVGSQESPPGEGYPYHLIFREFQDNPTAPTRDLAKAFVDGMLAVPGYANRRITQSVLDTTRLEPLAQSVDALAAAMQTHREALVEVVPTVRASAQSYSPTTNRVFRDLVDVCAKLEEDPRTPQEVRDAAALVRSRVAQAVVWNGRNQNSPRSHGVSIDFSSGVTFASSRTDYMRLKLAQDTRWDEWLSLAP